MFNTECPECKRTFNGKTEQGARQALGRHRAAEHGWVSPNAKYKKVKPDGTTWQQQAANLEKARAARWAGHKPKSRAEVLAAARKKYWESKVERAATGVRERLSQAAVEGLGELPPAEQQHRAALQEASWWRVENGREEQYQDIKLSECPCCGVKFRAIKPVVKKG